jgi:hypothetical protein
MKWVRPVARMGEMRSACIILIRKSEETISLGKPRHIWKYNIVTDLREIRWEGLDWTGTGGGLLGKR